MYVASQEGSYIFFMDTQRKQLERLALRILTLPSAEKEVVLALIERLASACPGQESRQAATPPESRLGRAYLTK